MRWKNEAGQAATESMMVISVVTIAVVAAGYSFVPMFGRGVNSLADDVAAILETGDIGGNGGGSSDGGNGGGGGSGDPRTPGNNAGDTRNGSAGFAATASSGNDVGSIPNRTGGGSPDPRYVPPAPLVANGGSPIPGNDGGPIGTDPDATSGAFPANRGSLGSAAPLAGMTGRNFGGGAGPGPG